MQQREDRLKQSGVGGKGYVRVPAFRDAEIGLKQPGVLTDATGEEFGITLLSAVIEVLVYEGSVILSEPYPLVLVKMLGAVVPDAGLIVRVSNETLIDGEGVIICPE